ncbi:MAG: AAA family ATPase [Candidatus Heimdallarchaeota archaeon]|nr:AAA family ATPase [Candidatus Heimdallarchaeota archaeon]
MGQMLIIIFGPPASGKMTVGKLLGEKLNYKLLHGHMTLELILEFFEWGSPAFYRLLEGIRSQLYYELSKSDVKGLILTLVLNLDKSETKEEIDAILEVFDSWSFVFIELEASLDTRIIRNKNEDRLLAKPSKRKQVDPDDTMRRHNRVRENSNNDFFYPDHHIKVCSDGLTVVETVERIMNQLEQKALI